MEKSNSKTISKKKPSNYESSDLNQTTAANAEQASSISLEQLLAAAGLDCEVETPEFDNNSDSGYRRKSIEIPKGIKVGHAGSDKTGVTVIIAEKGAIGGVDVRGCAPGTRETDLLRSEKAMESVNAIVLSGGSAYGLEASCGVMDWLREHKIGYKVGHKLVPIVSGAVLYDLNQPGYFYPDKKMGYDACENAVAEGVKFGKEGAGIGATVGKIRGIKYSSPGGIGAATVRHMGVTVTAIVAVNAFGDVYDHKTGKIIAGAKKNNGDFSDTNTSILKGNIIKLLLGSNTTIGCIVTDAKLSKVEANKLASLGHNGYAQSIKPVHTDYDGDTLFVLATGKKKVQNFSMLGIAVVEAVSLAITDAVK